MTACIVARDAQVNASRRVDQIAISRAALHYPLLFENDLRRRSNAKSLRICVPPISLECRLALLAPLFYLGAILRVDGFGEYASGPQRKHGKKPGSSAKVHVIKRLSSESQNRPPAQGSSPSGHLISEQPAKAETPEAARERLARLKRAE